MRNGLVCNTYHEVIPVTAPSHLIYAILPNALVVFSDMNVARVIVSTEKINLAQEPSVVESLNAYISPIHVAMRYSPTS